MPRTFKSKQQEDSSSYDLNALPIDKPIAVYYRQSSDEQVGNLNTDMQRIDLVEDLKRLGYAENKIILLDSDEGYSGTLPIDKRPGMKELFDLVADAKVGAVACQDEDRLFRDATGIQYNIFMDNCRKARVVVWTPSRTYIFHHPDLGDFYMDMFRMKCQMAAQQLKLLQGRLGGARRRLRLAGRWAGERLSVGYMVDMRNKNSETYRQIVPFPTYAALVQELFEVFVETGGKVNATYRRLEARGFAIPLLTNCPSPEGYATNYKQTARSRLPNTRTIKNMVTDPAYIGHYMLEGQIVRRNNHEAIIPEDLFFRAFNYVSKVDLDGNPNVNYVGGGIERIHKNSEHRTAERPLCEEKVWVYLEGEWQKAGVRHISREKRYVYARFPNENRPGAKTWRKPAEWFDEAVLYHLRARLLSTPDITEIKKTIKAKEAARAVEREYYDKRINDLEGKIRLQERNAAIVENTALLEGMVREYEHMQNELKRLVAEREAVASIPDGHLDEIVQQLGRMNNPALLPRQELRQYILALVSQIAVTPLGGNRGDNVKIEWVDGHITDTHLQQNAPAKRRWAYAELQALKRGVDGGWTQLEIAAACSNRSWKSIRQQITRIFGAGIEIPQTRRGERVTLDGDVPPLRPDDSFNDYSARVNKTAGGRIVVKTTASIYPDVIVIDQDNKSTVHIRAKAREKLNIEAAENANIHLTDSST